MAATVVLRGPPLGLATLEVERSHYPREVRAYVAGQLENDSKSAEAFLARAAAVPADTRSVKLAGCLGQPTSLPVAALALLPTSIEELGLVVPYSIPLLAALRRFPALSSLHLFGSAEGLPSWGAREVVAVLPKLSFLRLDYRCVEQYGDREPATLPPGMPGALARATQLTSLDIDTGWSADIGTLCHSVSTLRNLRLTLRRCGTDEAAAAVQMLGSLPPLQGLSLCLSNHFEFELEGVDEECDWIDGWSWQQAPPLSGLTALTELRLHGMVLLPPDWRQLSGLRRLSVSGFFEGPCKIPKSDYSSPDGAPFRRFYKHAAEDQAAALAGLAGLTSLMLENEYPQQIPAVEALAALPALQKLGLPFYSTGEELMILRPDLEITRA